VAEQIASSIIELFVFDLKNYARAVELLADSNINSNVQMREKQILKFYSPNPEAIKSSNAVRVVLAASSSLFFAST